MLLLINSWLLAYADASVRVIRIHCERVVGSWRVLVNVHVYVRLLSVLCMFLCIVATDIFTSNYANYPYFNLELDFPALWCVFHAPLI